MKQLLKKEPVTIISLILAIISAFFVLPDREYINYIDTRTLSILLCLMLVMAGLRKEGVFKSIGQNLLDKTTTKRGLVIVLTLLCFFFSMLITNDVALISFVPFSIELINMMDDEDKTKRQSAASSKSATKKEDKKTSFAIKLIVLETIAANLGSMLTPIGNPQNLYLYSLTGMSIGAFIKLMLPYSLTSLIGLLIFAFILFPVKTTNTDETIARAGNEDENKVSRSFSGKKITVYLVLFVLSLLVVVHVLPYQAVLVATIIAVMLIDSKTLWDADYFLLLTFIFLFIFVGNIKRISPVRDAIYSILNGREVITSVVASQFISNVPAAILLSGMTDKLSSLIIGTNLGGLGTLIASMASLISFKFYSQIEGSDKGKYLVVFTVLNLIFLIILLGMYFIMM
ncbi:MAG: citrate transporter [Butyrivibrio sp.]|uniref:SLC13 family permease n=1 Tax=Butyrivibrio sp. TaxID=28121 RepID=UPI0025F28173|nr:SLC13 family permease [Butyrivibrio sp.]MCR5770491.1 citrate transporter [Butyrivibrio sp.]